MRCRSSISSTSALASGFCRTNFSTPLYLRGSRQQYKPCGSGQQHKPSGTVQGGQVGGRAQVRGHLTAHRDGGSTGCCQLPFQARPGQASPAQAAASSAAGSPGTLVDQRPAGLVGAPLHGADHGVKAAVLAGANGGGARPAGIKKQCWKGRQGAAWESAAWCRDDVPTGSDISDPRFNNPNVPHTLPPPSRQCSPRTCSCSS